MADRTSAPLANFRQADLANVITFESMNVALKFPGLVSPLCICDPEGRDGDVS